MKNRKLVCFVCFFACWLYPIFGEEAINVSIRFFDQRIYYPESVTELRVSISNTGSTTWRFKLSDVRSYSMDVVVRDVRNQTTPVSAKYKIARSSTLPVFYRELSLEPGEEYSFVVALDEFTSIVQSGLYSVQAMLYPELYNKASTHPPLISNSLSLMVRPSLGIQSREQDMIDQETSQVLVRQDLSPDKIVEYILQARKENQWNKFFLYIDIEALYKNSISLREYTALSERERAERIRLFQKDLIAKKIALEISTVPNFHEVLQTSYSGTEASVVVVQKYQFQGYLEVKQYTYYLHRMDNIWKLVRYTVRNLGTE